MKKLVFSIFVVLSVCSFAYSAVSDMAPVAKAVMRPSLQNPASDFARITSQLAQGKQTLVARIRDLNDFIKDILQDTQRFAGRKLTTRQSKNLKQKLALLAQEIQSLTVIPSVPTVSPVMATEQRLQQISGAIGKNALRRPLEQVAEKFRSFQAKMSCIGNPKCSPEQYEQAERLLSQLALQIYRLYVVAQFGVLLPAAIQGYIQSHKLKLGIPLSNVRKKIETYFQNAVAVPTAPEENWQKSPLYEAP